MSAVDEKQHLLQENEALRTEVAALREERDALRKERDTLLQQRQATKPLPLTPVTVTAAAPSSMEPSAVTTADETANDPGQLLASIPSELSFLTPRGKFKVALHERQFSLQGKSVTLTIPHHAINRLFELPEATGQGSLLVAMFSSPIANGKGQLSHLLLHCKPNDARITCAYKDLSGQSTTVICDALSSLASIERTGVGSFKPLQGHGGMQCYIKATEASLYLLERELLVREGGKVHLLPYHRLRVEILPPDSRRTFDIQLECAPTPPPAGTPADSAAKPIKLELSMLPAAECDRVSDLLHRKRVNVNGSRDGLDDETASGAEQGAGSAAGGSGAKNQVEEEESDDEDDEDEDDDDGDFAPSEVRLALEATVGGGGSSYPEA